MWRRLTGLPCARGGGVITLPSCEVRIFSFSPGGGPMRPHVRIARHPYEEPHHVNLVLQVCNGRLLAQLEFYMAARSLVTWADHLEAFPRHNQDVFLFEIGSERPEDRWAYYLRFRAFLKDAAGHCALHFRFNNNAALPEREIAEFCLKAEASQINRLGRLCREFGALNHAVLDWWIQDGALYESIDDTPIHC
jgi:hypothetical protein